MANENEPIRTFATFVDKAIPMAGLKTPIEKFEGRNRSSIEPIHLLPNPDVPTKPAETLVRKELPTQLLAMLKETCNSLSANDATVLQMWIEGRNVNEVAAQLNCTADAVRAAREQLLRRIHVTIDPPSS